MKRLLPEKSWLVSLNPAGTVDMCNTVDYK